MLKNYFFHVFNDSSKINLFNLKILNLLIKAKQKLYFFNILMILQIQDDQFIVMTEVKFDEGVVCQTVTTITKKTVLNRQCQHTNILRVTLIPKSGKSTVPKITKLTAQEQKNTLVRLTQFQSFEHKYVLQDIYLFETGSDCQKIQNKEQKSFSSPIQSSPSSSSQSSYKQEQPKTNRKKGKMKKICLFQKVHKDAKSHIRRNTKNIPKNFCKAFINHMSIESKETDQSESIFEEFKKIEKMTKNKYNNIFLSHLFSHPRLCALFKQFLQHQATNWINNSKISDKQIHLQAIKIYLDSINSLSQSEGQEHQEQGDQEESESIIKQEKRQEKQKVEGRQEIVCQSDE